MEAAIILELAVWKAKINESSARAEIGRKKRMKMDNAEFRKQCHISCEADQVIENVLPYLSLQPPLESGESDDDSDSSLDDDSYRPTYTPPPQGSDSGSEF